jgi:hypothetical protein
MEFKLRAITQLDRNASVRAVSVLSWKYSQVGLSSSMDLAPVSWFKGARTRALILYSLLILLGNTFTLVVELIVK